MLTLQRRRGGIIGILVLVCLAIGLIWGGVQQIWTSISNTRPTEISAKDYAAQRPKSKWIKLKGCYLDLSEATYFHNEGSSTVNEVFIPIRPVEEKEAPKVVAVLCTKDPKIRSLVQKMVAAKTEEQIIALVRENKDLLFQERDVQGLVRFGIDLKEKDRKRIAGLDRALVSDFVLLDEGKKPDAFQGLFMLLGGVGCLVATVLVARGR